MVKEYNLTVITDEEGNLSVSTKNDGYTAIEILGIYALKQGDIISQLKGEIKPDTIKREVIKD